MVTRLRRRGIRNLLEVITEVKDLRFLKFQKLHVGRLSPWLRYEPSKCSGGCLVTRLRRIGLFWGPLISKQMLAHIQAEETFKTIENLSLCELPNSYRIKRNFLKEY